MPANPNVNFIYMPDTFRWIAMSDDFPSLCFEGPTYAETDAQVMRQISGPYSSNFSGPAISAMLAEMDSRGELRTWSPS